MSEDKEIKKEEQTEKVESSQENNKEKQEECNNCKEDNELNKIKTELEDTTDRFKRLMAEFDNFKKRSAKEREGLYQSLVSDIVSSFLPVADNLEKAVGANTEDENYKQGVMLVLKQFTDVLTSVGVKEIEGIGSTFNPEYHEAVSSVQDESLGEKEIKEVFRKGYMIGDKVIRHAMVVVAN